MTQVPLRQIAPTSHGGSHALTSSPAARALLATAAIPITITAATITSAAGPRIERARNTESARGHGTGANLGTLNVVTGNTTGLKPSQKHALERVYRRRLRPAEVASAELAAYLCQVSREIERQVGILVGRRGEIEHVFVGDASRINLPEIGRIRAGRGRFRGLRLVHTHLRNEPLTRDDLVDLALLRLDLVAAIGVWPDGRPADLHVAHLLPPVEGQAPWRLLPTEPFFRSTLDADALIEALEEEFERVAPAAVATDGATARCWSSSTCAASREPRGRRAWPSATSRAASPSCVSCAARPGCGSWASWSSAAPTPTPST